MDAVYLAPVGGPKGKWSAVAVWGSAYRRGVEALLSPEKVPLYDGCNLIGAKHTGKKREAEGCGTWPGEKGAAARNVGCVAGVVLRGWHCAFGINSTAVARVTKYPRWFG